ncbi:MAG TPA: NAD(P)H-dependent glycerol-3-phosphate dehydrogenase [Candidatus Hydrogenedentes bacterium]|nr:NAD(P)H-dependent glycerol-3-phosphate dehydrogenase [Candidatus Hydrogenedentota bacterium]HPG67359.1 NAD(P)H-dependent glycerol-3-phosphate dehydrogenase [Candidatus Hydrogenedentota bacterium]
MKIQVVGAGSWGLALTRRLALNRHEVRLWCRAEDDPDYLRVTRTSRNFLPDMHLPESVEVTKDVDANAEMAVLAVPSHAMGAVVRAYPFSIDTIRVSVAKGIENDTLLRMSEVIRHVSGACPIVALSGPTHAEEVAQDLPASIVAAGEDADACLAVQHAFLSESFRVYTSGDLIGTELGGALKNVIAIAAGACDGLGLGDNAKAALMTRGLAEIARLGVALGADPLTFAGLSGMGDLIVTCASRHSRNRAVGEKIARGMTLDEITASTPMVAEGVRTTRSVVALAHQLGIEMPIAEQVYRVLFDGADPHQAVTALMLREAKPERE